MKKLIFATVFGLVLLVGCTSQSTKQAMIASARTDTVQAYVGEKQHSALKILLFRDTLAKLDRAQSTAEKEAILNDAWQQLDTFEFWAQQDLLARCYRIATVDAKLASDQGILDLLFKDAARTMSPSIQKLDDLIQAWPTTQPTD